MTPRLADDILAGGYWQHAPRPGGGLAIVYSGVVASEAIEAHRQILEDEPGAGLLAVPSPDRLHGNWTETCRARMRARQVSVQFPCSRSGEGTANSPAPGSSSRI